MNKEKFMAELKEYLVGLKEEDIKDVLEDYEEHFAIGKKNNRKESKIAKSLGKPKEIAKQVRTELRKNKDTLSLELFAVNFWVTLKDLSIQIFKYARDWIKTIEKKIKKASVGETSKKSKTKTKKAKSTKKETTVSEGNFLLRTLLVLFNIFIFIWVWIGLLVTIISLYISGIAVIVSGFVTTIASIFMLSNPIGFMLKNIGFSGVFAGIGITLFGILFFIGINQIAKGFSYITKQYMKFNKRIFGGRSK